MEIVNGLDLHKFILSGFNNLKNYEELINRINVFPVSDSDTGTNMVLTISSALKNTKEDIHVGNYLSNLSKHMLLGARGNSGVILSQMFKGLSSSVSTSGLRVEGFINALLEGYKKAYCSTILPKEGTILNVLREGINNTKNRIKENTYEEFFKIYLEELLKEVELTIDKLDILKENNVVDAGGYAYYKFIEGMYLALLRKDIQDLSNINREEKEEEYSSSIYLEIKDFIHFDIYSFTEVLKGICPKVKVISLDSLLVIKVEEANINNVLGYIKSFGVIVASYSIKEEFTKRKYIEDKSLYIVAFSSSKTYDSLFECNGVDIIFDSNKVNLKEVIDTLKFIKNHPIVVFSNAKKNIDLLNLAIKELDIEDNVNLIETKDELECYFSLMMDIIDNPISERISSFKKEAKEVKVININNENNIDPISLLVDSLSKTEDIDSRSVFLVVLNPNLYQYHLDEIIETLEEKFPYIEIDYKEDECLDSSIKVGVF